MFFIVVVAVVVVANSTGAHMSLPASIRTRNRIRIRVLIRYSHTLFVSALVVIRMYS